LRRELLTLRGEWDTSNASAIIDAVTDAIEAGCSHVALDLRDVTYLDSTGLAALLKIQKQAEYSTWDVTFVKPADRHVWRLFEMTALTARFAFAETRAAALIAAASTSGAPRQ
jgi:anti-anti-sigma factor